MENEKVINDARFERMEHHLKLLKEGSMTLSSDVNQIKSAIIGSEYSGGVGLVHRIKQIDDRLQVNEDKVALLEENLTFSKNIVKTLIAIILSYIAYLFTK